MNIIRIRFPDDESKRRALGFLAGRFSFTSYETGEMLVVEDALTALAVAGIPFSAEGPAPMPKSFRRFELLLPTKFNDERPVPAEAFADTLLDLELPFWSGIVRNPTIQGQWRNTKASSIETN